MERLYGLSDRVRDLADGLLFLELKAEQAGLGAEEKWGLLGEVNLGGGGKTKKKKQDGEAWFLAEFEHWRSGGPGTPSIGEIEVALGNAPTKICVDAIMSGDMRLVMSLQGERL